MKAFKFNPDQTFRQARQMLAELNNKENRALIAHLIWQDVTPPRAPLTYLWDPYAERFGHQIDKEPIDTEIVNSLVNDIPVRVELVPAKAPR